MHRVDRARIVDGQSQPLAAGLHPGGQWIATVIPGPQPGVAPAMAAGVEQEGAQRVRLQLEHAL